MFEVKDGKVVFKHDDEEKTKAGAGVAIKLNGERLVRLQSILGRSGWVNPAAKDSSEATKSWKRREALTALALKLLDVAIATAEQHSAK